MTVHQCRRIVSCVPYAVKAKAIKDTQDPQLLHCVLFCLWHWDVKKSQHT